MQIDIFCLPEELVIFAKKSANAAELSFYAASYEDPLEEISSSEIIEFNRERTKILIGSKKNFDSIKNISALKLYREDVKKFISMRFGRQSEEKIEASSFLAENANVSPLFFKSLKIELKKNTRTDLIDPSGNSIRTKTLKFYYTIGAAQSGKNFSQFLGQNLIYRPATPWTTR